MDTSDKLGFGPHLMLNCYECSKERLSDRALVLELLNDLPEKIGMTKVSSPQVFEYHDEKANDKGLSGVVLIAESHIAIHTFPEKEQAFIDVFSCRDFDTSLAAAQMISMFEAKSHDVELSSRGVELSKRTFRFIEEVREADFL